MATPLLCELGHVATTQQLTARGVTAHGLRAAVADGRLLRPRRGTYACAHASPELLRAAALGGAVTCVSVLRAAGVWAGNSTRLHLELKPGTAHPPEPDIRFHTGRQRFDRDTPWIAGRMRALWCAMNCLDVENAVAAMESAIHEGFLPVEAVLRLAKLAPRRLEPFVRELSVSSGSGNETIVRTRLQSAGFAVEVQGGVPGLGHQDLVVEECLGLEIDGRAWHGEDRYALDHDRDLRSEGFGRHVLRLSTSQIHATWPNTLAVIDRVIRDAKRERDRRRGRVVVTFDDPL